MRNLPLFSGVNVTFDHYILPLYYTLQNRCLLTQSATICKVIKRILTVHAAHIYICADLSRSMCWMGRLPILTLILYTYHSRNNLSTLSANYIARVNLCGISRSIIVPNNHHWQKVLLELCIYDFSYNNNFITIDGRRVRQVYVATCIPSGRIYTNPIGKRIYKSTFSSCCNDLQWICRQRRVDVYTNNSVTSSL